MADDIPITKYIGRLRSDSEKSAAQKIISDHFFTPLVEILRKRFLFRGKLDAEDAVNSAMRITFQEIEGGKYADLPSRENLFAVLFRISVRKAWKQVRDEKRQKRGAGKVLRMADLADAGGGAEPDDFLQIAARGLPPDLALQTAEEFGRRLARLDDEQRQIFQWKCEDGLTNKAIAARLGCVETTVERKLQIIRSLIKEDDGG
jgi:RNA polymerase sigma factor (sigma-70 family)